MDRGISSIYNMENYQDDWDRKTICGLVMTKLKLEDGKIVLRVRGKAYNYDEAETNWRTHQILPANLRDFIAGLSILPQGIGNGVDSELEIELQTEEGFIPLPLFDDSDFFEPYIFWTNDGGYDNDELAQLQSGVDYDNPVPVNQAVYNLLSTQPLVLAMDIEGFTSLFRRRLPLSFILGLEACQSLCHICETHLVELPEEVEERLAK